MKTTDFLRYTSKLTGVPIKQLKPSLDALCEGLTQALLDGEEVNIWGIGKFYMYERTGGYTIQNFGNPTTAETRYAPKFKPYGGFKRLFNE